MIYDDILFDMIKYSLFAMRSTKGRGVSAGRHADRQSHGHRPLSKSSMNRFLVTFRLIELLSRARAMGSSFSLCREEARCEAQTVHSMRFPMYVLKVLDFIEIEGPPPPHSVLAEKGLLYEFKAETLRDLLTPLNTLFEV